MTAGRKTSYGVLDDDATLTIERLLPGPVDRVWAHLTKSELRRKWLAAGDMTLVAGAPFEFTWRNDELSVADSERPEGFPAVQTMDSRIIDVDPPRRLSFTWNGSGDVSIELQPRGDDVLLTLVHRRLPDRSTKLSVGAGWHMHLDLLLAIVSGTQPEPFWKGWLKLRKDYEARIPA